MIAMLKGVVAEVSSEALVLDCGGVGYEALCPSNTLAQCEAFLGKPITIWTYTHVREDALQLFGFLEKFEKEFFLSLLKVNGVGPKMALHILSGAGLDQILDMIESEDVKGLSKLPKVGKKTAEQIILTLKGKLVRAEDKKLNRIARVDNQLVSALVNLGYKQQDVEKVVSDFPQGIEFQEGVRRGLQALSGIM